MYIRKTTRRNKKDGKVVTYYSLAESVRVPGQKNPHPRIIHNFGRRDQSALKKLEQLAASIHKIVRTDSYSLDEGFEVESSLRMGVNHIVRELWNEIGVGEIIDSFISDKHRNAPHAQSLLTMVAHRLDDPGSKLACHANWLQDVWLPEADGLSLNQLYRAMDVLAEHGVQIEQEIFWRSANLFNMELDLVFYDTTTTWFEIDRDDRGAMGMRKRGYSKDDKHNNPQIVIALAVTREGIPVRSWVLPGNTTDVTTVKKVKDDLCNMNLGQAIFVADAGMHSAENLQELERNFGRYILATRLGSTDEVRQDVLGRQGRYSEITDNLKVKEVIVDSDGVRKRYILCLNKEEVKRQRAHRKELLTELKGLLQGMKQGDTKEVAKLFASRRYGRYLSKNRSGKLKIDMKKVKKAKRLDGKFVLETNVDSLTVEDVACGFKGMWIIESCFRRMKTITLRVRPIFHYASRRIESHVRLCVLALLIQRTAEQRTGLTWRRITEAVNGIHAVRIKTNKKSIVRSTEITKESKKILKNLGIPRPCTVLSLTDNE